MRGDTEDCSIEDVYFTPTNHKEQESMSVFTFGYEMTKPSHHPHQFSIRNATATSENFPDLLDELKQYLRDRGDSVRWGIGQSSGAWYGFGIGDLIYALDHQQQRYDRDSPQETHGNETMTAICNLRQGGKLFISSQPILEGDLTNRLRAEVLTDGVPMNTSPYQPIADIFDGTLGNITPTKIKKYELATMNLVVDAEDVIGRITEEKRNEVWVTNPIIKNPTAENPEMISRIDVDSGKKQSAESAMQAAAHVVTHGNHALETDVDYRVDNFIVENLSTMTGFNTYNYDVNATYLDN